MNYIEYELLPNKMDSKQKARLFLEEMNANLISLNHDIEDNPTSELLDKRSDLLYIIDRLKDIVA